MYIPAHFNEPDRDKALTFISANPFGQLISRVDGRLFATHLPFMLSEDESRLQCHMARENPQWEGIEDQEVLVTFQGPHDYISPGWYSNPGVPTWNYQVVHVYGTGRCVHAPDELKAGIDRLVRTHEKRLENPWVPDYPDTMLSGIVGIEIPIAEIQCKFKLNQNRSKQDREGVMTALEALGARDLAAAMRDHES